MNELRFRECARPSRDTKHKRYFSQCKLITSEFKMIPQWTVRTVSFFFMNHISGKWAVTKQNRV